MDEADASGAKGGVASLTTGSASVASASASEAPPPVKSLRVAPLRNSSSNRPLQSHSLQHQQQQPQQQQQYQQQQQQHSHQQLPSRDQVQKEYRQELVLRERRAARARRHRLEQIQRMAVRLPVITVDTSKAKSNIEVLRLCLRDLGWKEYPFGRKDFGCDIYWHSCNFHDNPEVVTGKVNKFPGMNEVVRKVNLFRTLETMRTLFPNDFGFYPRTWFLPAQFDIFSLEVKTVMDKYQKQRRTFIVKPDEGSQGEGIYLIRDPSEYLKTDRRMIVQEYLDKPFLMDNLKFDLRIYVLLSGVEPLEFYVYKEGLVRFCTVPYARPSYRNLNDHFMHLTNYSLNKHSNTYVHTDNQEDGSKRTLTGVFKELERMGHSTTHIWREIETLIAKTMIAITPELKIEMSGEVPPGKPGPSCFQILGFDILLLHDLKPMLLEVNASPSMRIDFDKETSRPGVMEYLPSPVDEEIKRPLIRETLKLIAPKKKWKRIATKSPPTTAANSSSTSSSSSSSTTSTPKMTTTTMTASSPSRVGGKASFSTPSPPGSPSKKWKEKENRGGGGGGGGGGDATDVFSLIFPTPRFRCCERFRVMDRVASLFYCGVGVRGSLRMAMTGLRNLTRKCQLIDVVVNNADLDILYLEMTKRWSSMGLCYQAFVEIVFRLATKKRRDDASSSSSTPTSAGIPSSPSPGAATLFDSLSDFLDYCEKHLEASKLPKLAVRVRNPETLVRPPLPPLAAAALKDRDGKVSQGSTSSISKAMVQRVANIRSIYNSGPGNNGNNGGGGSGSGGEGSIYSPSPTKSTGFRSPSQTRTPSSNAAARTTPRLPIMGK